MSDSTTCRNGRRPGAPLRVQHVDTGVLDIAYLEYGAGNGPTAILLHGFPYDVNAFDRTAARLATAGVHVVVPWLRGYGPTRFASEATRRSGQQAALAHDLLDLMNALDIPRAVLAGFDWGGRAACIMAALWPDRAAGLVSCGGYNIQDIAKADQPLSPAAEHGYWYQYYFHGERGRAGLAANRAEFCRLLWRLWSPEWAFGDATFAATAPAFDNPDFVDVVIHSYRHRFGLVAGDPAYEASERRLAAQPPIEVPSIMITGNADGIAAPGSVDAHRQKFSRLQTHLQLAGVGHNPPQEAPEAFADAVLDLVRQHG